MPIKKQKVFQGQGIKQVKINKQTKYPKSSWTKN